MRRLLPILFLVLLAGQVAAQATLAATFSLSPNSKTVKVGDTFSVQVLFDTGIDTASSIKASIIFPPSLLSVETDSIVTIGSAVTDFKEKIYSNQSGTIDLSGNTSASGSGKLLASIKFKTKALGTANITFDTDSQIVRSSDSKNVLSLTDSKGGSYVVSDAVPLPSSPEKKQATPSIPKDVGFDTPTYLLGFLAITLTILGITLVRKSDQNF